jgi:hypothetical protein
LTAGPSGGFAPAGDPSGPTFPGGAGGSVAVPLAGATAKFAHPEATASVSGTATGTTVTYPAALPGGAGSGRVGDADGV